MLYEEFIVLKRVLVKTATVLVGCFCLRSGLEGGNRKGGKGQAARGICARERRPYNTPPQMPQAMMTKASGDGISFVFAVVSLVLHYPSCALCLCVCVFFSSFHLVRCDISQLRGFLLARLNFICFKVSGLHLRHLVDPVLKSLLYAVTGCNGRCSVHPSLFVHFTERAPGNFLSIFVHSSLVTLFVVSNGDVYSHHSKWYFLHYSYSDG